MSRGYLFVSLVRWVSRMDSIVNGIQRLVALLVFDRDNRWVEPSDFRLLISHTLYLLSFVIFSQLRFLTEFWPSLAELPNPNISIDV